MFPRLGKENTLTPQRQDSVTSSYGSKSLNGFEQPDSYTINNRRKAKILDKKLEAEKKRSFKLANGLELSGKSSKVSSYQDLVDDTPMVPICR